jgi:hypothetical protein
VGLISRISVYCWKISNRPPSCLGCAGTVHFTNYCWRGLYTLEAIIRTNRWALLLTRAVGDPEIYENRSIIDCVRRLGMALPERNRLSKSQVRLSKNSRVTSQASHRAFSHARYRPAIHLCHFEGIYPVGAPLGFSLPLKGHNFLHRSEEHTITRPRERFGAILCRWNVFLSG